MFDSTLAYAVVVVEELFEPTMFHETFVYVEGNKWILVMHEEMESL